MGFKKGVSYMLLSLIDQIAYMLTNDDCTEVILNQDWFVAWGVEGTTMYPWCPKILKKEDILQTAARPSCPNPRVGKVFRKTKEGFFFTVEKKDRTVVYWFSCVKNPIANS